MIARLVMFAIVLTVALLLQTVVAPAFAIGGWRPDLLLLTVVAFALADGPETGARYGFAAGLSADLLSGPGQLVGLTALVLLVIGYLVGGVRPYLPGTAHAGEVVVGAVAGLVCFGVESGLAVLLDVRQFTVPGLVQGAIATAVWTGLLAPLVCGPIAAISRRWSGADVAAGATSPTGSTARTW